MRTISREQGDVDLQRKLHYQAKQFRKKPTEAENYIWQYLKGYRIYPYRFRRQYPIDRYIVDFCCTKKKLIIEIDGEVHNEQIEKDTNRTLVLDSYGFTVIRFSNYEILEHIEIVLKNIQNYLV